MEPWRDLTQKPWDIPPVFPHEEGMTLNGKDAYLKGIKDFLTFLKKNFPQNGPHIEREVELYIKKLEVL